MDVESNNNSSIHNIVHKQNDNVNNNDEGSPLLQTPATTCTAAPAAANTNGTTTTTNYGRMLLVSVAFAYGSLSVSLRSVYERPGPPAPSILSATRGWMSVLCLLPFIFLRRYSNSHSNINTSGGSNDDDDDDGNALAPSKLIITSSSSSSSSSPSSSSSSSPSSKNTFWLYTFELAVLNFGMQSLINIGLVTTSSARVAFLTQLSVVLTPILGVVLKGTKGQPRTWLACFIALLGLYILSSSSSSSSSSDRDNSNTEKNALNLSFGDLCCIGSAFCWSYYIYRLSDWGHRFDEAQTMIVKNFFMAVFFTLWTILSYYFTTTTSSSSSSLWEGYKDPISWLILFYSAASSGSIADVLQQKGQKVVPASESNVLLSLEPVFTTLLGFLLIHEIPTRYEIIGGFFIVASSILVSI